MVLTLRAMFSPSLLFGSSSTHSGDSSSCRIDDKIYGHYPNTNIDWLELRKEREEPQHEFIILRTNNDFYRIERRPPKGANIPSKLHGIKAEDTIIHLNHQDYEKVWESADIKIIVAFYHDLKPGLHSLFSLCDAIRVDPDAEKYTLAQFNCYFFARTLILLLTRHFLIRQYCNQGLPRNDFANLSGPDINVIVDQVMIRVMNIWLSQTVENTKCTYEKLRQRIDEMNQKHCAMVNLLGENGGAVYDSLDRKTNEIWRHMYSNHRVLSRLPRIRG